jgi:hypothetical protein
MCGTLSGNSTLTLLLSPEAANSVTEKALEQVSNINISYASECMAAWQKESTSFSLSSDLGGMHPVHLGQSSSQTGHPPALLFKRDRALARLIGPSRLVCTATVQKRLAFFTGGDGRRPGMVMMWTMA